MQNCRGFVVLRVHLFLLYGQTFMAKLASYFYTKYPEGLTNPTWHLEMQDF